MDTQVIIALIAAIVIVLVALGVWYYVRRTTSRKLRDQFGPEYDHAVRKLHSEELAEAELKERKKRVANTRSFLCHERKAPGIRKSGLPFKAVSWINPRQQSPMPTGLWRR